MATVLASMVCSAVGVTPVVKRRVERQMSHHASGIYMGGAS